MFLLRIEIEGLVIKGFFDDSKKGETSQGESHLEPAHVPSNLIEPPENYGSVFLVNIC